MPRVRRRIPIGLIDVERVPLVGQTLEMAKLLQNGHEFKPIKVQKLPNGRFRLKDGRHRYAAHKLCGLGCIEVVYGHIEWPKKKRATPQVP